jgi:hypothetical protein
MPMQVYTKMKKSYKVHIYKYVYGFCQSVLRITVCCISVIFIKQNIVIMGT